MATDIVKKLEWGPYPNEALASDDVAVANIEFRHAYQAQRDPRADGYIAYLYPRTGDTTLWWESRGHTTLEVAQAAAQANYEQRILSALSQDYLDLKASHDAARTALRLIAAEAKPTSNATVRRMATVARAVLNLPALTTPAAPVETVAADDDGWIAWEGGECPVDLDACVTVRLRYGDELTGYAGIYTLLFDWWKHEGDGEHNIIAYRPAAGGAL